MERLRHNCKDCGKYNYKSRSMETTLEQTNWRATLQETASGIFKSEVEKATTHTALGHYGTDVVPYALEYGNRANDQSNVANLFYDLPF